MYPCRALTRRTACSRAVPRAHAPYRVLTRHTACSRAIPRAHAWYGCTAATGTEASVPRPSGSGPTMPAPTTATPASVLVRADVDRAPLGPVLVIHVLRRRLGARP